MAFGSKADAIVNHGAAIQFYDEPFALGRHPEAHQGMHIDCRLEREAAWKVNAAIIIKFENNRLTNHGIPTSAEETRRGVQSGRFRLMPRQQIHQGAHALFVGNLRRERRPFA